LISSVFILFYDFSFVRNNEGYKITKDPCHTVARFLEQSLSNYSIKYPSSVSPPPLFCRFGSSSGRSRSSSCLCRSVPKRRRELEVHVPTGTPATSVLRQHYVAQSPVLILRAVWGSRGRGDPYNRVRVARQSARCIVSPCDCLSLATKAERLLKTHSRA